MSKLCPNHVPPVRMPPLASLIRQLPRMAPHLAESPHVIIGDMIASKVPFKAQQIANVAGCSRCTVYGRRSKRRPKASPNHIGRPRSITPPMLDALCEHLRENPVIYGRDSSLSVGQVQGARNDSYCIKWTKKKNSLYS